MSVGGVVGAAVGFFIGGPAGAQAGYALGSAIAGPQGADIEGPRLQDRDVPLARYGAPVLEAYGPTRVTAQVLWSAPLREVRTEEDVGKGGGGQQQVTYTYFWSAVLSLGWASPDTAPDGYDLHRVWVNKKLVVDYTETLASINPRAVLEQRMQSDILANVYGRMLAKDGRMPSSGGWITFEGGGSGQTPPTVQQEAEGVENTPGYMRHARLDVRDLPLSEDVGMGELGNRPPLIEAEISLRSPPSGPSPLRKIFSTPGISNQYMATGPDFGASPRYAHWPVGNEFSATYTAMAGDTALGEIEYRSHPTAIAYNGPPRRSPWAFRKLDNGPFAPQLLWDMDAVAYYDNSGLSVRISRAGAYMLVQRSDGGALYGPGSGATPRVDPDGATAPVYAPLRVVSPPSMALLASSDVDEHCTYLLYKRGTTGMWLYRVAHTAQVPAGYAEELDIRVLTDATSEHAASGAGTSAGGQCSISVRSGIVYLIFDLTGAGFTGRMRLMRCDFAGGEREFMVRDFVGGDASDWRNSHFFCDDSSLFTYHRSGMYHATVFSSPTAPTTVGAVAAALMRRAGLTAADIDVVDAETVPLHAYAQARRTPARAGIEQLTQYTPAQVVESDGKIKMRLRRAGDAVTAIDGEALLEPIDVTRVQDKELPREITVGYAAVDSDQQPGAQSASWLTGVATAQQSIDLAMTMSDQRAADLAKFALVDAYARRTGYKFSTSMHHADLEPGDVVNLPGHGLARISSREEGQGRINFEASAEAPTSYAQAGAAASGAGPAQVLAFAGMSDLLLIDSTPPLRDDDTAPAFYAAYRGDSGGWRGAYLAVDQAYAPGSQASIGAQVGRLLSALPAAPGGFPDLVNTVDIVMLAGQLASVTFSEARSGAQMIAIGGELVGVQYAELIAVDTYRCRGFARGLRGSEIQSHAEGARVVRLTTGTVRPYTYEPADIGASVSVAAVSIGQALAAAMTQSYTLPAGTSRLLSPVHLRAGRLVGGDIEIRWNRRGRFDQALRDSGETRLDDTAERYEIEVKNGAAVVRTISATSESAVYTNAQQVADFGSTRTSISVVVYQISSMSGRGRPGAATLSIPA